MYTQKDKIFTWINIIHNLHNNHQGHNFLI